MFSPVGVLWEQLLLKGFFRGPSLPALATTLAEMFPDGINYKVTINSNLAQTSR